MGVATTIAIAAATGLVHAEDLDQQGKRDQVDRKREPLTARKRAYWTCGTPCSILNVHRRFQMKLLVAATTNAMHERHRIGHVLVGDREQADVDDVAGPADDAETGQLQPVVMAADADVEPLGVAAQADRGRLAVGVLHRPRNTR